MIEYIFGGILLGWIFGIGVASEPKEPVPQIEPRKWKSEQHTEAMLVCRTMCGKGDVLSYDPMTGECQCREK